MDDLISRGDAIKAVLVSNLSACTVFGRSEEGMATAKELIQVIKNLPSVQPDRKTGNWIHNSDPMAGEGYWNCSECGLNVYTCTDYCPNCGADMRGDDHEND